MVVAGYTLEAAMGKVKSLFFLFFLVESNSIFSLISYVVFGMGTAEFSAWSFG